MRTLSLKVKDRLFIGGLVAICISLFLFLASPFLRSSGSGFGEGMFLFNYLVTVIYLVKLILSGRLKRGRNGLQPLILLLVLALISAYSLNREMNVFQTSAPWFCIVLVIVCVNYILFCLFEDLPGWMKWVMCAISGTAMVVFAYLSIYLVPYYLVSIPAVIALGISLHAFVPLLFCIYTIVLIRQKITENRHFRTAFICGITATLIFVIGYAINWNNNLQLINKSHRYSSITENDQLPAWVNVAQQIKKNGTSEKILKSGLVYAVPVSWDLFDWKMSPLGWDRKIHDPLVMLSTFICGDVDVPEDRRIKILESLYDSRHQAQERLWSGKDIVTDEVQTKIELWPKLRLAYSELNLTITHQKDPKRSALFQEAIYTFHVPEGGVVTSLSLWIEGHEEKAVLTSKAKAKTAYTTIVGKESRDPSVVHWQEGNTVTVRVFPILKNESRKFKIGITSPLRYDNNRLYYDNIYFDGPSFENANESISVHIRDHVPFVDVPAAFSRSADNLSHNGSYTAGWSLACAVPELSTQGFHFDHHSYSIAPIATTREPFDVSDIYLDVNASWSREVFDSIYELAKSRKVWVATGGQDFTSVTEENKHDVFADLHRNQFSLFPFFKIDARSSLVITHSDAVSPTIDDIRASRFLEQCNGYFAGGSKVKVINLGPELSPYLKSLKEFRMLEFLKSGEQGLTKLLAERIFEKTIETDTAVAIATAGIMIQKTADTIGGTSPDHLMRLFAYNDILRQAGPSLLSDRDADPAIVSEAEQAYVVSPVSSLIVLETQQDYDRFDINKSKNSLQNANMKSKGAVPEPAEWALIFLVLLVCTAIKFYPKISYTSGK